MLGANKLEPRSGPTYVGPGLGSSLFATVQNTDRLVFRLKRVNVNEIATGKRATWTYANSVDSDELWLSSGHTV